MCDEHAAVVYPLDTQAVIKSHARASMLGGFGVLLQSRAHAGVFAGVRDGSLSRDGERCEPLRPSPVGLYTGLVVFVLHGVSFTDALPRVTRNVDVEQQQTVASLCRGPCSKGVGSCIYALGQTRVDDIKR